MTKASTRTKLKPMSMVDDFVHKSQAIKKRHSVVLKRKDLISDILVNSKGVTYRIAVDLYWYLRSFHNPIKARKRNGNVISITKLHTDGLHLNRDELAKAMRCSKRSISQYLAMLERFGLIARDYTKQGKSVNHLVLYVLKNTPHFYNEFGVSEDRIKDLNPHTNSTYIEAHFGVKFNAQNVGFSTAADAVPYCSLRNTYNLGVEEVVFQTTTSTTPYENSQNKKNNINLVENNSPETALKKSSCEHDFYALTDDGEISTYCYDTARNDIPEYATAEFGLPLKVEDLTQTPSDTKEPLPQPTASVILTKPTKDTLPEPQPSEVTPIEDRFNQMVSMQDLMQLIPEPTIATKEEDKPMALPQPKQDLRQHLNYEIHRTFPKSTSENLQESLVITPIGPNKIGLKFNKTAPLKTDEKEQLRQCIKLVYGDGINMVLVKVKPKIQEIARPVMPSIEETESRCGVTQPETETRWTRTRDYLIKAYDKDLVKACLQKVNIIEHEDQVTFKGTTHHTEFLHQKLETGLTKAAKETGLTFVFDGFCRASNERYVNEIKGE